MNYSCSLLTLLIFAATFLVAVSIPAPKYSSTTTVLSLIPRGGTSTIPKKNGRNVKVSTTSSNIPDVIHNGGGRTTNNMVSKWFRGGEKKIIVSKDKRGWVISFVLSLIYLVLYILPHRSTSCFADDAGFCVKNLAECRKGSGIGNSFIWAWNVDMVFTVIAILFPIFNGTPHGGKGQWLGRVLMIFAHGVFHKYQASNNCPIAHVTEGALAVYSFFIFIVSAFIAGGFGDPKTLKAHLMIALSSTALITFLTKKSEGSASPIFLVAQILAPAMSLFMPHDNVTALAGYAFVVPCFVSIIELIFCCNGANKPSWFNKIGGHVWYDFFLHLAVILGLLQPKDGKGKVLSFD
jgi:hypothetical protein